MPPQSQQQDDVTEKIIAVMGATGTGKSTFINLASGSEFVVSDSQQSCTAKVEATEAFDVGQHRVILIDTPGFNDTNLTDKQVLQLIVTYLEASYRRGIKLTGVLYLHDISTVRMTGSAVKNFRMFKKLCGEGAFKNVVIVTNRWGEVEAEVGVRREAELKSEKNFYKLALDGGAQVARHVDTARTARHVDTDRTARHVDNALSAEEIIGLLLNKDPVALRVQEEIIRPNTGITDTGAGMEVDRDLQEQIKKHEQEKQEILEEREQALKDKDDESRRELEIEAKRVDEEIEKFQNERKTLESDYKKEMEKLYALLEDARGKEITIPIFYGTSETSDKRTEKKYRSTSTVFDCKEQLLEEANNDDANSSNHTYVEVVVKDTPEGIKGRGDFLEDTTALHMNKIGKVEKLVYWSKDAINKEASRIAEEINTHISNKAKAPRFVVRIAGALAKPAQEYASLLATKSAAITGGGLMDYEHLLSTRKSRSTLGDDNGYVVNSVKLVSSYGGNCLRLLSRWGKK